MTELLPCYTVAWPRITFQWRAKAFSTIFEAIASLDSQESWLCSMLWRSSQSRLATKGSSYHRYDREKLVEAFGTADVCDKSTTQLCPIYQIWTTFTSNPFSQDGHMNIWYAVSSIETISNASLVAGRPD
jgi:hypothetical protein